MGTGVAFPIWSPGSTAAGDKTCRGEFAVVRMAIETFTVLSRKSIQRLYPARQVRRLAPRGSLRPKELSVAWESVEYMWPSVRPLVPVS